jgi:hypothetical protein
VVTVLTAIPTRAATVVHRYKTTPLVPFGVTASWLGGANIGLTRRVAATQPAVGTAAVAGGIGIVVPEQIAAENGLVGFDIAIVEAGLPAGKAAVDTDTIK